MHISQLWKRLSIKAFFAHHHRRLPGADKIAYILTDVWTHHAGRTQEEARVARSSAGTPEGSANAGALPKEKSSPADQFPSTSGDTEQIVVDMEGDATRP